MESIVIFIPAYEAEKTIEQVLIDIPKPIYNRIEEILLIDDGSKDRTFEIANKLKKRFGKLTVLKNEKNMNYGGNLKKGYNYAISKNYDILITLHGDGQHFPQDIPKLLQKFDEDKDLALVFGSRFNKYISKSRMPLYKYIGNKILTFLLNLNYGTNLSEFHSGFRVYRLQFLKKINYNRFSDRHLFDTQLLSHFIYNKFKIGEIPCATIYGPTTRSMSFFDCCLYIIPLINYTLLFKLRLKE